MLGLLVACNGSGDRSHLAGETSPPHQTDLDCNGNRVWASAASGAELAHGIAKAIAQATVFISEGAASLTDSPLGDIPCAVVWEFRAAAPCSLAFAFDSKVEQQLHIPLESASGFVSEAGGLNLTINRQTLNELQPAGVSFEQLFNSPDCPLPTGVPPASN